MSRLLVFNFKDFPPNGLSPTERGREGKHWQLIKCQRSLYYTVLCFPAPPKWFHSWYGTARLEDVRKIRHWQTNDRCLRRAGRGRWSLWNFVPLTSENWRGASRNKRSVFILKSLQGREGESDDSALQTRSCWNLQHNSCMFKHFDTE